LFVIFNFQLISAIFIYVILIIKWYMDMEKTVLLPCRSCGSTNRVRTEKLSGLPKCGKCHQPLEILNRPVTITSANFEQEVIKWPGLILVDFWADWCGPCKMIAPVLEKLSDERAGKLKIGKVDTEREPQLSARFAISSIPTLMLWKNGKKVNQIAGALPKPQLEQWIDSFS
jgi:thioredoxin 2